MSTRRRRSIIHAGSGAPPTPKQIYAPGWWTVLLYQDLYNAGGTYTGIPAGADIAGTEGVCASHDWVELEPNGRTDSPSVRFAAGIAMITAELAVCAAMNGGKGRKYTLRLGTKSYVNGGTNPVPLDMQQPLGKTTDPSYSPTGYATYAPSSGSVPASYSSWRWHPVNQSRWKELIQALSAAFGTHPLFAGINTQETALGYSPNAVVDSYTPALYNAALINEAKVISGASPLWRPHTFMNFHPGSYTDAAGHPQGTSNAQGTIYLAQVAAAIQQYGAVLAFPDLVTQGGIVSRVYDIHAAYQSGGTVTRPGISPTSVTMPGSGPIGGSMQHDELSGAGVGDTPVCTENLFNWGTSQFAYGPLGSAATHKAAAYNNALDHSPSSSTPGPFVLDYMFVNYTGGAQAQHMFTDYPTFGPFVPS